MTLEMERVCEFCKKHMQYFGCKRLKLIYKRLMLREINHRTALRKIGEWSMVNKNPLPPNFDDNFNCLVDSFNLKMTVWEQFQASKKHAKKRI